MHVRNALVASVVISLLILGVMSQGDVVIRDKRLYVEGKEYFIKGMSYKPIPLGVKDMDPDGWGGGGLCSAKKTPYDEWKSACYDLDVFDGSSSSSDRVPLGPDQWFYGIWSRDFPYLKELGVNTLRLYSINPMTEEASIKLNNENPDILPYGKEHTTFMDLAHKNGFKVMFPLISDLHAFRNDDIEDLQAKFDNLIEEVGNHSALLMWVVGHNWDMSEKSFRNRMKTMIEYARTKMEEIWDRQVPITYCSADTPENFASTLSNLGVDVFCANAGYRADLKPIFDGISDLDYRGWDAISNETGVPFVFGEIGYGDEEDVPQDWFNRNWHDIVTSMDKGCIGGNYFEYSDEPHTQIEEGLQERGVVSFVPTKDLGQTSLEENVFWPDSVNKKTNFNSVKSGKWKNRSINFNTDVFEYNDRNQGSADGVEDIDDSMGSRAWVTWTFIVAAALVNVYMSV